MEPSIETETAQNSGQPAGLAEAVLAAKKPSVEKSSRRQIRGSSLLLVAG